MTGIAETLGIEETIARANRLRYLSVEWEYDQIKQAWLRVPFDPAHLVQEWWAVDNSEEFAASFGPFVSYSEYKKYIPMTHDDLRTLNGSFGTWLTAPRGAKSLFKLDVSRHLK